MRFLQLLKLLTQNSIFTNCFSKAFLIQQTIESMKTIFKKITVLLFILISAKAKSQDYSPKNFPEAFAGIEWNTTSGLTGISFERYVFQKNNWVIGVKASHAFTYQLGNMSIMFSSSDNETVSFTAVTGTVHKFFSGSNRGFFLCSELGGGSRKNKYYEVKYSTGFVAFEAGLGWQFHISNAINIRWTNTLSFAGAGGITMTKLSIGF